MTDLARALDLLLDHEGGLSDHASDRGGRTNKGVTQATYTDWRRRKGLQPQDVARITQAEVEAIYDEGYWRAAACDKLPWPLSYVVFDAAVNSGPARAKIWLQQGLGVPADGAIGPKTLAAARSASPAQTLAVVKARADFIAELMKRDPSQTAFAKGWMRRLLDVLAKALTH